MLNFNKRMIILFLGVFLFVHSTIEAIDTKEEKVIDSVKSLAIHFFGEDSLSQINILSSKIDSKILKFKDSKIPFSTEFDSNKVIWKISINEIPSFSTKFILELRQKYPRNLNIYIDSMSGIPIKIVSQIKGLPENLYIESSKGKMEEEFLRYGDQYFGIPTIPPTISFLEAFSKIRNQNVRAKEIVAYYVVWGNMIKTPRPAWVIQLRGDIVEDAEDVHPKIFFNTNYSTNVIDAETGELIGGIEVRRGPREDK